MRTLGSVVAVLLSLLLFATIPAQSLTHSADAERFENVMAYAPPLPHAELVGGAKAISDAVDLEVEAASHLKELMVSSLFAAAAAAHIFVLAIEFVRCRRRRNPAGRMLRSLLVLSISFYACIVGIEVVTATTLMVSAAA